jgi:hypothetical protein
MTDIDKLERLHRLREGGGLSSDEYEREKARVLAGSVANVMPFIIGGLLAIALIGLGALFVCRQSSDGDSHPILIATPTANVTGAAPAMAPNTAASASAPVPAPIALSAAKTTTANRTHANYYNHAKRDMMRRYWDQPAGIRKTLGDWAGANELCRGGADVATLQKWCPIHNTLYEKLRALGMCYGRPADRSAAESDWHTCTLRDRG